MKLLLLDHFNSCLQNRNTGDGILAGRQTKAELEMDFPFQSLLFHDLVRLWHPRQCQMIVGARNDPLVLTVVVVFCPLADKRDRVRHLQLH